MANFGSNNFFRLMNSLDEENINPLRKEGATAIPASNLEDSIMALSPSFTRMGMDMSVFTKATTSLKELPKTWQAFIAQQAKEILTADMDRLISTIGQNFESRQIKSSEINAIVNFVFSYYEVIHRRSINKKEVIEGVLMRGLIKKSSFYSKISQADRDHEGVLTWDSSIKHHDDIWRHFTLQTCRFLKQATTELDDLLHEASDLRQRLQAYLDQDEQDQFNQGVGKRSLGTFLPMLLFFLGIGGLMVLPNASQSDGLDQPSYSDANTISTRAADSSFIASSSSPSANGASLAQPSSAYASALSSELQLSSNAQAPMSVDGPTATVKFQP